MRSADVWRPWSIVWLSVVGLALALCSADLRPLTATLALPSALTIYLASAPLDWVGNSTFGARRLVVLTPIFVALAALAVDRMYAWLAERRTRISFALCVSALAPMGMNTLGEVWGLIRQQISADAEFTQRELYGVGAATAWQLADEFLGDVAIWPAEIYFSLRYGLPMRGYRHVLKDSYSRNYRDLAWTARSIDLTHPHVSDTVRGFIPANPPSKGVSLVYPRGAIMFTASWPYATDITLGTRSRVGGRLRVGFGTIFGVEWMDTLSLGSSDDLVSSVVRIPRRVFDSGLNELVFEFDGPRGSLEIATVELDDKTEHPPSF